MKDEELDKIEKMNREVFGNSEVEALVTSKTLNKIIELTDGLKTDMPDIYTIKVKDLWKDFYEIIGVEIAFSEYEDDEARGYLYKNALHRISTKLVEDLEIFEDSKKTTFGEEIKLKTYYCKLKPSELHLLILAALGIDKARDEVIDWLRG